MPFLQGIEDIKASSALSAPEKAKILAEMIPALPAPVFCKACPETLAIISSKLGVKDVRSPPQPPKEVPQKGTNASQHGKGKGKPLLLDTDADGGGEGPKKAVVNKKAQKWRKATGNT